MKKIICSLVICSIAVKAFCFTQIVTVQNHVFTPSSFTITIGDTITWKWIDGSHTTTSVSVPTGAATWSQSINTSSQTFTYVPTKTGSYSFKCIPHASMGMTGSFTVKPCPQPSVQISAASATSFCKGGSVILNSNVSANITAYQWKDSGVNISGARSATFKATTTGLYTLRVTNSCGNVATSNAIGVTVIALPQATITPSGTVNLCTGDTVKLQASTGGSQTYQWLRNNSIIAGATKSSFVAKTAGSYKVTVTKTTTGCSKTSAATKVVIADCIAAADNQVKVYPNPSSGNFHILLPAGNDEYSFSVFNGNGNPVSSGKINSTDFIFGNNLKPGLYLIQIKKKGIMIAQQKVMKE